MWPSGLDASLAQWEEEEFFWASTEVYVSGPKTEKKMDYVVYKTKFWIAKDLHSHSQGISVPQNWQFCQILVIDIPKYISLSSFNCKTFCEKRFLLDKVIKKKRFYE